eukprot:3866589-Prymnesium_polylepis.1
MDGSVVPQWWAVGRQRAWRQARQCRCARAGPDSMCQESLWSAPRSAVFYMRDVSPTSRLSCTFSSTIAPAGG